MLLCNSLDSGTLSFNALQRIVHGIGTDNQAALNRYHCNALDDSANYYSALDYSILTKVYMTSAQFIAVYLTAVHLIPVHLTAGHLTSVHLTAML